MGSGGAGIGAVRQRHALGAKGRWSSVVEEVEQQEDSVGEVDLLVAINIEKRLVGGMAEDAIRAGQRPGGSAEEVTEVNDRVGDVEASILGDVARQLAAAEGLGVFSSR